MKEKYLFVLRDKKSSIYEFRLASRSLAIILAKSVDKLFRRKDSKKNFNIVFIPILRSGLCLLDPFLEVFGNKNPKVGFVGVKRDSITLTTDIYLQSLPKVKKDDYILILDAMLATGITVCSVIEILKYAGLE